MYASRPRHDAAYAEHASPDSIRVRLRAERAARARLEKRIAWLEDLLDRRTAQIAAGEWPPASPDTEETDAR